MKPLPARIPFYPKAVWAAPIGVALGGLICLKVGTGKEWLTTMLGGEVAFMLLVSSLLWYESARLPGDQVRNAAAAGFNGVAATLGVSAVCAQLFEYPLSLGGSVGIFGFYAWGCVMAVLVAREACRVPPPVERDPPTPSGGMIAVVAALVLGSILSAMIRKRHD